MPLMVLVPLLLLQVMKEKETVIKEETSQFEPVVRKVILDSLSPNPSRADTFVDSIDHRLFFFPRVHSNHILFSSSCSSSSSCHPRFVKRKYRSDWRTSSIQEKKTKNSSTLFKESNFLLSVKPC